MRPPPHLRPGEILQRLMAQLDLSTIDVANTLKISPDHVVGILEGQRVVTPDSANRLARHFGTKPELWLHPQRPAQSEGGPHVTLAPSQGVPVSGRHKDKKERISEAIRELQLAIDGLQMQEGRQGSRNPQHTVSAFARMCSVFLRKLVLGDYGKRETRLLDDAVMKTLNLRLPPLRKIRSDRRRVIRTGWAIRDGSVQFTKIDEPGPVLPTYRFHVAAQEIQFSVEWPLPGTADWVGTPTDANPWLVSAEQLFETASGRSMTCDNWLGQQVIVFDSTPVSLKCIIRSIANFEGAHAINMAALNKNKRGAPLHLLNSVTLFGVPLPHIIVIETALYLYERLVQEPFMKRREGDYCSVRPGFTCTPEQACSSEPDWLQFDGSMTLVFSSEPQAARYSIKPPGR